MIIDCLDPNRMTLNPKFEPDDLSIEELREIVSRILGVVNLPRKEMPNAEVCEAVCEILTTFCLIESPMIGPQRPAVYKVLAAIDPCEQVPASYPGLTVTLMGRGIVELDGSYKDIFNALVNVCGYSKEEAARAIIQ